MKPTPLLLLVATSVLIFIFMKGIWNIDIGASAWANDLVCTDGFSVWTGLQAYHIGLYEVMLSFFFLSLITIYSIVGRGGETA